MSKNAREGQRPDPRGPVRQIVSIEERSDGTLLTKSCGHTSKYNQIFHYTIGASVHCMQCLETELGDPRDAECNNPDDGFTPEGGSNAQ